MQRMKILWTDCLCSQKPLDVTNHSVAREVVTFFTLPPGEYIVMPQTNVPNCDGKFLLRILTDEQSNIWEVNEDNVLIRNILGEFEDSLKYVSNEMNELLNWLTGISPLLVIISMHLLHAFHNKTKQFLRIWYLTAKITWILEFLLLQFLSFCIFASGCTMHHEHNHYPLLYLIWLNLSWVRLHTWTRVKVPPVE